MAEETIQSSHTNPNRLGAWWGRLRQNPVVVKELRSRMRAGRGFIVLTVYLILLSALVSLVYFIIIASNNASTGQVDRQILGKTVFGAVVAMELMLVCFIAPALTAAAISSERERQTYDLLRTTLLPARSLVFGKLTSALSFLLLLLLAAFPLQSLAFLFGGVAFEEVIIASIVLVVTALAFSAIGLFFSSFIKTTLASTVIAYVASILLVFGIPMLIFSLLLPLGAFFSGATNNLGVAGELALILGGWLLVSINPVATIIATEVILVESQSAFYTNIPITNGVQVPFISPWISYTILFFLASILLIKLSVRFVKQVEK